MITEFTSGLTCAPRSITKGPDGNVWFTEPGGGIIGRLAPQGGTWASPTLTEYTIGAGTSPTGITAGPDGNLWFTDKGTTPAIGRITPQGVVTEYSTGLSSGAMPEDITAGDDGNLWFTENNLNGAIGRITTAGVITEFAGATGTPESITRGPDESLWFTSGGSPGAIGRVTPDGTITMFSAGLTPNQAPAGIAAGDNGRLYFTESGGSGAIGSITTHGTITEYTTGLTASSAPSGLAPGADGNIWFTENASPGALGRMTLPPDADTRAPIAVTDQSATLVGVLTANSQAASYYFEYGTSSAYGSQTPTASAGSGASPQSESASIAGLSASTTYHYRIVASNASGTTRGPDRSFTTQPPPSSGGSPSGSPGSTSAGPATPGEPLSDLTPPGPEADAARAGADGVEPGGVQPGELTPAADEPRPVLGRSVVLAHLVDGVSVKVPGGRGFSPLSQFRRIPVGSIIDARRGKLRLTSAAGTGGGGSAPGAPTAASQRQSGVFWGGVFKVTQTASRRPETDLTLVGGNFAACRAASPRAARAARSPRSQRSVVVRSLWGRDRHSAFRTHGRNSVATVRGTEWLTQDRCDGTRTQVSDGAVSVRNLHTGRRVLVRAPHQYLARTGR
ncbi:MAG TPA: hypothetical protein VGY97_09040 [Solirubrobacteraceae bacterium]|nr:hypothetical protein [Solirubrobacteraceae bacterium]